MRRPLLHPTRAAALAAGALLALTACAEPDPPPPSTPSSVAPEASQVDEAPTVAPGQQSPSPHSDADRVTGVQVIGIELQGGQPVGGFESYDADVGVPVTFEITSDTAATVHAHGPDEEIQLTPGQTTRFEVTYDAPGSYEVELHGGEETQVAEVLVR